MRQSWNWASWAGLVLAGAWLIYLTPVWSLGRIWMTAAALVAVVIVSVSPLRVPARLIAAYLLLLVPILLNLLAPPMPPNF